MSQYESLDSVAVITLDNGKANAVNHDFIDSLIEGLDVAERDARAVLIRGRAGMFSAGFDLKEFEKGPQATTALVNRGAELLLRIFMHPQPVIAECTGHAIAAGALLLLACDSRLGAAGKFKLGLNETAIGFALPVFGFELAKARLSKRHLQAAAVQAQLYDPLLAKEVGYLDEVLDPAMLHEKALEVAATLGKLPAQAYAANKRGLRQQTADTIRASLA